jgi:hypothetical protein
MNSLRILLLLLTFIAGTRPRGAETSVSGVIDDETWTAAGSPYLVKDDVLVSSLVIQPGVEVRFLSNYVFMVQGILRVKGEAGSEVRFTSTNAAVGWQGISFVDSVPGSFLNNCIIENSRNSGVRITNSPPTGGAVPAFTNCMIINNYSPLLGGGIDATLNSGDLVLDNCLIGTNTCAIGGGGINVTLKKGALKMSRCNIVGNVVTERFRTWGGGIKVSGDSVLLNCLIADNVCNSRAVFNVQCGETYGGGVFSDTGNANFNNCRFERNIARTAGGGTGCATGVGGAIYSTPSAYLKMQNCVVATNICEAADNPGGAGIHAASSADIINCTIVGNNTQGLYSAAAGTVNCVNSIVYFNNNSFAQIVGPVTVTYGDVQGGAVGVGNLAVNPNLRPGTLELLSASPLIDKGNPDALYYDVCFPPSRGLLRNDIGAYGGPGACGWGGNPNAPTIITQPQPQWGCPLSTSKFSVNADASAGPLTYQWFQNITPLANQTGPALTVTSLDTNAAGFYSVMVSNASGGISATAPLYMYEECAQMQVNPGNRILNISGPAGTYIIKYTTNLANTNFRTWTSLATNTTTGAPWLYTDSSSPASTRFYGIARHIPGLIEESFEGTIDPRISVEQIGQFISPPGVKGLTNFGSQKAFGFGKSVCSASCFRNFVSSLKITFAIPVFVSKIEFSEMELGSNWGSHGQIYGDGVSLPDSDFGREPQDDRQADTVPRFHSVTVGKSVSTLVIEVENISNISEIFLDDLIISGQ